MVLLCGHHADALTPVKMRSADDVVNVSKRRADAVRLFADVLTGSLLKPLSTGNSRDGVLHPPCVNNLPGLDANEQRTHMIDPAPHALAAGAAANAERDCSSAPLSAVSKAGIAEYQLVDPDPSLPRARGRSGKKS